MARLIKGSLDMFGVILNAMTETLEILGQDGSNKIPEYVELWRLAAGAAKSNNLPDFLRAFATLIEYLQTNGYDKMAERLWQTLHDCCDGNEL